MLAVATYLALAEAAEVLDMPLVGHIPERVALGTAIVAGQEGMEHFGRITMACATAEEAMVDALRRVMDAGTPIEGVFAVMAARNKIILETWDEALCARVLASIAEAGLHMGPTLVVAGFYIGDRPAADDPRMQMLPAEVKEAWGKLDFRLDAMTEEVRRLAPASIALERRTFAMAHAASVPNLAASNASFANPFLFHGASLLDELDLYADAGMTPREALFTAIVAPPRFFDLPDQNGTIGPGLRADLVLLDTNPLAGLRTLRRPKAVIVAGRLLNRSALDAMETRLRVAGE